MDSLKKTKPENGKYIFIININHLLFLVSGLELLGVVLQLLILCK